MAPFDVLGNIVVVKFSREEKLKDKKKWAERFLKEHKNVSTVLEKLGKFSGRLRTQSTKFLKGTKTKEALYRENGCEFRFNVDSCYFSPRLSSERKEVAGKVKKGERVLVMFGGVAPFAVVVGKLSRAEKIVSVEIGKECNKYAKINVKRNKLDSKVEIVNGDVKKVIGKGKKVNQKFDRIVMARPNLKDSFLKEAFSLSKKGTRIYYYDFCRVDEIESVVEKIKSEAKKSRKKIKILKKKIAGEVGPYKIRVRIDFRVL